MSGRAVKQQLAAFLAGGAGPRLDAPQQGKNKPSARGTSSTGKGGKGAKQKQQLAPAARKTKKQRDARRRKDKKRATDVPVESTREQNLRLLAASAKRNSQVEDLLAQLTGVGGGGEEELDESDFDDLDF